MMYVTVELGQPLLPNSWGKAGATDHSEQAEQEGK